MIARRDFLSAVAVVGVAAAVPPRTLAAATRTSMYLAYTSFAVRLSQGRDLLKSSGVALPADAFGDLCARFATRGGQLDFSQLPADAQDRLAEIRQGFASRRLELEVSMPARFLETPEQYARAVGIARGLGATRARVALLSGRRYESFATPADWTAFTTKWRETLVRLRPEFDRQAFAIGLENHKDWLAPELVALIRDIGSPHVGVCVDFGNNLALLEDPDETIAMLAPLAVTTHLKDMAVRATDEGFELSEVPLGAGVLPLERYVAAVRRARPDARLCLEMITRDPLRVPYRTEAYWVAFDAASRAPARVRAFESRVLAKASTRPLPRVSHLDAAARLAAEDDNIRASVTYARDVLKLEAD